MMSNGSFTITAHRNLVVTPEEVWAVVSDTSRYVDWVDTVLEVQSHHGPARVGGSYTERIRSVGPLAAHVRWTVRQIEPMSLRVDTGEGLSPLRDVINVFRFASLANGCTGMTYEFHFSMTPRPVGALVRRLLAPSMRESFDASMRRLESVILSERPPADKRAAAPDPKNSQSLEYP
ncbi:SRPBCC family protein [Tsukamurella tyrosinosolvens]|uniref:SRPBCC family protein n=1 Tax=Tsukamurella tyrosinosolvens TaxID=57704 RepID=UPI002DD42C9A|nr:SRPBCC family protein [Tsukamurella tyrosinosolvens]MEC4616451.1 SRPBCC family protein [Tsukamurella tyrosinosolvens]